MVPCPSVIQRLDRTLTPNPPTAQQVPPTEHTTSPPARRAGPVALPAEPMSETCPAPTDDGGSRTPSREHDWRQARMAGEPIREPMRRPGPAHPLTPTDRTMPKWGSEGPPGGLWVQWVTGSNPVSPTRRPREPLVRQARTECEDLRCTGQYVRFCHVPSAAIISPKDSK